MTSQNLTAEVTLGATVERFRTGDDTPTAAVERALQRIDETNGTLHAFLAVDRDRARADAESATAAWHSGENRRPLLGVPISVKDTIEVEGMPTTYGSRVFRDNLQGDSVVAERLRRQGAIIIGKTNTPEFALVTEVRNRLTPPGRNPLDPERTCGGSSGGAAASVAAGMSIAAIGTDSAGSIRIPAAYQGLVGFKPSYQRIPWVQEWKASATRSHTGPITRDVADAWELTKALSGPHWGDPTSRVAGLEDSDFDRAMQVSVRDHRILLILDPSSAAEAEESTLVADLEQFLRITVGQLTIREWDSVIPPAAPATQGSVWPYSAEHVAAALSVRPDFFDHIDELTDYARPIYEAGRTQVAHEYLAATNAQRRRALEFTRVLAEYDFAVTVSTGEAPRVEESYTPVAFPRLATVNIAGVPAVSIPFGSYASGLPRALQIIGHYGDDAGVLAVAEKFTRLM